MAGHIDAAETAATACGEPRHGRDEVRLWLRLLTCTSLIEGEIRRRLRRRFGITLPRFDLMAQLDRAPGGLALSDLSRRMMVSNGNLTGLVERLVASGRIERRSLPADRRVQLIRLTALGQAEFRAMAAEHEGWVATLFADLGGRDIEQLMQLLAKAKLSAARAKEGPS